MEELVLTEVADSVATLTLNRPDRKNAFTPEMVTRLAEAVETLAQRDDVNVLVLTGAGEAFCTGADVGVMKDREDRTAIQRKDDLSSGVHRVLRALHGTDKPLLCAVNGLAVGAGLDFALMCDLIYMADSAKVGETYVRMGLFPGAGATWTLPRRVGTGAALELLWSGTLIDAEGAQRIGLADRVVPRDELMTFVADMARKIAGNAPLSVRYIKRAVRQGHSMDFLQSLDFISSQLAILGTTADHREAVEAFLQKRSPRFRSA